MSEDRRLAAIVFSDIVSFTELMGSNEKAAMALLDQQRKLLRPIIENFGGEWLKEMGDGILFSFSSAVKAVTCSLEIQRILEHDSKLTIRIGIHIGDVIKKDGDVFGDGVNIASRLEPLAEPGGICVSERVYDDIRNKPEITANFQDEQILKGVDRPIRVYSIFTKIGVVSQNIEEVKNTKTGSASYKYISIGLGILLIAGSFLLWNNTTPEPALETYNKSIAVLPFDNYSTAEEDAFFSDGVTEIITANLAKIKDLKVISRTSVMVYKNTIKSIKEIGRELDVAHVLEGSVQRIGDNIRITGQLIETETDKHLWAESYDGTLDNFFTFQSDIAFKIAGELHSTITAKANELITDIPTKNMKAWRNYLKGLEYFRKSNNREDLEYANHYFELAYKEDSTFIAPLTMSANTDLLFYWSGNEPKDKMVQLSKRKIDKAKSINPHSAQVLNAEGTYYYYGFRDYEKALDYYSRAMEIEPGNSEILSNIGFIQRRLGIVKQSLNTHEKSLKMNPNDPILIENMRQSYRYLRNYHKSLDFAQRITKLLPEYPTYKITIFQSQFAINLNVDSYINKIEEISLNFTFTNVWDIDQINSAFNTNRNYQKALEKISTVNRKFLKTQNFFLPISYLKGEIYTLMGESEKASMYYNVSLKELNEFNGLNPDDYRVLGQLAINFAVLGDSENAINFIKSSKKLMNIDIDPFGGPIIFLYEIDVYLYLNQFEKCLDLIEYSASINGGIHAYEMLHPKFDSIRENPRFINVFKSLQPLKESDV